MNRRGYSTYTQCKACGTVIECPDCSIPMIWHASIKQLKCHYCNKEMSFPEYCPACGSDALATSGVGTQKIEELVDGKGDLTRQIEISSGDEFEVIANNVNRLFAYIRQIMLNISKNSDSLKISSDNMTWNLSETKKSMNDVSSTMENMSEMMGKTTDSLCQIEELMKSITTTRAPM